MHYFFASYECNKYSASYKHCFYDSRYKFIVKEGQNSSFLITPLVTARADVILFLPFKKNYHKWMHWSWKVFESICSHAFQSAVKTTSQITISAGLLAIWVLSPSCLFWFCKNCLVISYRKKIYILAFFYSCCRW